MALKTDYKDDIYQNQRKYAMMSNQDGTVSISDATVYTQQGDRFGANDINATNAEVNKLASTRELTLPVAAWSSSAPYTQEVPVAGITSDDVPVGCPKIPIGASAEYKKSTTYIDGFTTEDGKISFYCNRKKPTVDVTVIIKGV